MCFKLPAALYLVLNTIVSALLSGSINAGITAAMYRPDIYKDVKLFVWPNTLAGNFLVTTLAQCGISWFLIGALIRNGQRAKVLGIGRFKRPQWLDRGLARYLLQSEDLIKCQPFCTLLWKTFKAAARALLFGFTMVWIIGWPVVFIMLAIEETSIDQYEYWWLILLIGVYGVVLQVLITPFISYIALASPPEEADVDYEELSPASRRESKYKQSGTPLSEKLLVNQL